MNALLFTNWNFMRVLRLLMGAAALYYAITTHDNILGAAGIFLLVMTLLNIGCCGAGGCSVPGKKFKSADQKNTPIHYEEIK